MSAPLDGLRVLDVSTGMVAAVATMVLADYGADVVHVDRWVADVAHGGSARVAAGPGGSARVAAGPGGSARVAAGPGGRPA